MTRTKWLICIIAAIGFAFDIYELLMLPLIARPALMDLAGIAPGTPEFGMWIGRLFYIPALMGGIFGLLGGYLTDLLGRRRVLTWSIVLYAVSAFASGYSTSVGMLLFFRCTTFIGVCVEFVAAVAWLAELFSEPEQREKVLGYTQAFSSIGGMLVALVNGYCVAKALSLPAIGVPSWWPGEGVVKDAHAAWRYTLMSGLIPAIPLMIIRPFLPESPAWAKKKAEGTLRRPNLAEIFAPNLMRTTIVTTLMVACSYGVAFGAIQQLPQIVPGLPEVVAKTEGMSPKERKQTEQATAANVAKVQEVGGLVGRFIFAFLAVKIVSRQKLIRCFQFPGIILLPLVFGYFAIHSLSLLSVGIFFVGLVSVAQFSFWGNYLPRVYPIHLRGTGESFAANVGGRMIGTSFAWVTSTIAASSMAPGGSPTAKLAYTAVIVGGFVIVAGLVLSYFLPEPPAEDLPE